MRYRVYQVKDFKLVAATGSLHLDSRRSDDRPPLLDLGLVVGAMRLRRLLVAREDVLAEIGEL